MRGGRKEKVKKIFKINSVKGIPYWGGASWSPKVGQSPTFSCFFYCSPQGGDLFSSLVDNYNDIYRKTDIHCCFVAKMLKKSHVNKSPAFMNWQSWLIPTYQPGRCPPDQPAVPAQDRSLDTAPLRPAGLVVVCCTVHQHGLRRRVTRGLVHCELAPPLRWMVLAQ